MNGSDFEIFVDIDIETEMGELHRPPEVETIADKHVTYWVLKIINFTDPRITKLQSQIHPECDQGWGSSKPILPTGHRELLEEQWQSL